MFLTNSIKTSECSASVFKSPSVLDLITVVQKVPHRSTSTHTLSEIVDYDRVIEESISRCLNQLIPESFSEFPEVIISKYADKVQTATREMQLWCVDVYAKERHLPRYEDYNRKCEEICREFELAFPDYPVGTYYAAGSDDTSAAGAFLLSVSQTRSEADECLVVDLLSRLRWLIGKRDELPVPDDVRAESEACALPPEDNAAEHADENLSAEESAVKEVLSEFISYSTPAGTRMNMLGEIYTVFRYLTPEKPWKKNKRRLALFIAPLIGKSVDSITSALQRYKRRHETSFSDDIDTYKRKNPLKKWEKYARAKALCDAMQTRLQEKGVISAG